MTTTVQAAASALAESGIRTIFGVAGDGNVALLERLVSAHGLRYVASGHESGAISMADGYSRSGDDLGIATVTHGPGLTNSITALVEATKNRSRLLVLSGDTPRRQDFNLQDSAQRHLVEATGAGYVEVRSADLAASDVLKALRQVIVERRPTVISIPRDIAGDTQTVSGDQSRASVEVLRQIASQRLGPDDEAIDVALGVAASARRPLILAGRGATAARTQLVELARLLGAPLATTLFAKDLFRGEALNVGIFGSLSHGPALDAIMEADCILAFGAALNRFTTYDDSLTAGKAIVQCDVEARQLGRWSPVTVGVVGDAQIIAESMIQTLREAGHRSAALGNEKLARRLSEHDPWAEFEDVSTNDCIDIRAAVLRLDEMLPSDRHVVVDGGRFVGPVYRYLGVQHPSRFHSALNFGSIGLSLATAIGVAVANPETTVVAVVGDGGFMLGGLTELNTAVRHDCNNLVVVVLNDHSYGAEHVHLQDAGHDPTLVRFDWPDLAEVARSLGAGGCTVRKRSELDAAIAAITTTDRPHLIDIRLDVDATPRLER